MGIGIWTVDFINLFKAPNPVHVHTGPAEMLVSNRESDTPPPATVESIYSELVEFY